MPHSKTGKLIQVGSIIKGPNVSAAPGIEFIGVVHTMRTGQTCSGDAKPLAIIHTLADGTRLIMQPVGYFNEAFDADKVEVID